MMREAYVKKKKKKKNLLFTLHIHVLSLLADRTLKSARCNRCQFVVIQVDVFDSRSKVKGSTLNNGD